VIPRLDRSRGFVASSVPMLRSQTLSCVALSVAALSTLSACGPDLGPCDMEAATEVIYKRGPDGVGCKVRDASGGGPGSGCDSDAMTSAPPFEPVTYYIPYYRGQAIAHSSCGNGGVCHSEKATGALRHGAPHGLDFDVAMAVKEDDYTGKLVHEKGVSTLRNWIEDSWELIDDGSMPPGQLGAALQAMSTWFNLTPGSDPMEPFATRSQAIVPALSTAEGKEEMRNWLACGAPVATGVRVGQRGPDAIQPTWDDIHSVVIQEHCTVCHAGSRDPGANGDLILTNACASWKSLFERPASGRGVCATFSGSLIVPNDPDSSLLLEKVENLRPSCGSVMPFGATELIPQGAITAIREWIEAGASAPPGCVE